jgi:hypothetical protein
MDFLTPLVVIPLAWAVLDAIGGLRGRAFIAFLLIAALWVEAHGIHLAANAIGDGYPLGPERDAFYATDPGALDHWLDEDLGHWAWHIAWVALDVLMLWQATRRRDWPSGAGGATTVIAGMIHGAVFAVVTTEGGTAALGATASVVLLAWSGWEISHGSTNPIPRFLAVSSVATLLLYVVWAALNGGQLVEPCSVIHC